MTRLQSGASSKPAVAPSKGVELELYRVALPGDVPELTAGQGDFLAEMGVPCVQADYQTVQENLNLTALASARLNRRRIGDVRK